jgi:hypothetical protein
MSTTLVTASHQWATRPDDERFISLDDMQVHFENVRNRSAEKVVPSRQIHAVPDVDNRGLKVVGPNGHSYAPTNWAFGQVAALAESPAGYLRTLPAPIAADCINYGLQFKRNIEDVGVLLQRDPGENNSLTAATGPRYGRIWNADILQSVRRVIGNGVDGVWKVPGEFGKAVTVTKENTTLYAGDRDMFIFLADEANRIEVPNRRNGQAGSLARGFFMWNSEVGSKTFGLGTFLFDFVCCNRIVWGAEGYQELKIRHTASAPDRFIEEVSPALLTYSKSSVAGVTEAIKVAQAARMGDKLDEFLGERFGKRMVAPMKTIHQLEEDRPIETLWDVTVAATAYAKTVKWQDDRVAIERIAGGLLKAAA